MSSDLSFRVYPGPKGPPFRLVREGLLLAPYTVLMLATTVLVFGTISGWRLWLAVAVMLPLHVYLTTDLLLPHFRKAEVMGYGLDRRGPEIRFVGYAGRRRFFHGTTSTIAEIREENDGVEVFLAEGDSVRLDYLSPRAQTLFAQAYRALAAGAGRGELLGLDPGVKNRCLRAPRFDDGSPRPYRRFQSTVILLMLLPELLAARELAAWIRPMLP